MRDPTVALGVSKSLHHWFRSPCGERSPQSRNAEKQRHIRNMRQVSSEELRKLVSDFLESIGVLPKWIDSSASDRPGRGHYEWGNWSDALREKSMWVMGGPWRTMIADIKTSRLISTVSEYHKLKDQAVWEIVEQTYLLAERNRSSTAPDDTVKTRIRSVFSWQRRHDVKKNSLIWFLDFAFAMSSYCEFQARMLFKGSPIPNVDAASMVPTLAPADFGIEAYRMEQEMISYKFLPFYMRVQGLADDEVLLTRRIASSFCERLSPPVVDMDIEVRETRGMPREEKAIDFMTPWLQKMASPEHDSRWWSLIQAVLNSTATFGDVDLFKAEVCRSIVMTSLQELSQSDNPEAGYVYDIAASTAIEHGVRELRVPLRMPGQKRKRMVVRRTLRSDLDERIVQFEKQYRASSSSATVI